MIRQNNIMRLIMRVFVKIQPENECIECECIECECIECECIE